MIPEHEEHGPAAGCMWGLILASGIAFWTAVAVAIARWITT